MDELRPNATIEKSEQITHSESDADKELSTLKQEQWITFCALGGLITEESDDQNLSQSIKQMPVSEFAHAIGIHKATLYRWKQSIPNFSERVRTRRYEVFSLSRETTVFNRAYLIAMSSKDHKAAGDMIKLLLGHFSRLDLPVQRQEIEHKLDNWGQLVEQKRKEIVEGQVVDEHPDTSA